MLEKLGLILISGLLYSITIAGVAIAARHVPVVTLTSLRLAVASLVLGAVILLLRPRYRFHWRGLADIAVLAILNVALPFLCLAVAVSYISGALIAALFNTTPVFTVLIAHYLLPDEKLNTVKVLGTITSVAGATLLLVSDASGLLTVQRGGWIGQLLIIAASLLAALGVIYARLRVRRENVLVLAGGQAFGSLALLAPLALLVDGAPALASYPWQGWTALLVAALAGPVLAFCILFYITNKYSASLAGFAGIATPLFSLGIGLLFLGEVVTLPIAAGIAFLLLGVWSLQSF